MKIRTTKEIDYLCIQRIFFYYTSIYCASVSSGLFVIPCRIRSLTVPETLANDAKRE